MRKHNKIYNLCLDDFLIVPSRDREVGQSVSISENTFELAYQFSLGWASRRSCEPIFNPDLSSDFGYTLYLKHELARSESKLREALKMSPEHRAARNNLGLVLGEQKRFDEALAEFLKGVVRQTRPTTAHEAVGDVFQHFVHQTAGF